MIKEKYAILDTDFISKTHLIRKDEQNKLIDRIIELPGYRFYCHEETRAELSKHHTGHSPEWLGNMINDSSIHCCSDKEILEELSAIYSGSAKAMYVNMLKTGCEAFRSGYFEETFKCKLLLHF